MNKGNPYRATQLWNELVEGFRRGVPCKTHWWQLRRYEGCFTGAEASTWLHRYLQASPSIPQKVSRSQVVLLLGKFLKNKIIERVPPSAKDRDKFKDGSLLYKVVPRMEPLKPHNASTSRVMPPPPQNHHTTTVMVQAWRDTLVHRLSTYMGGIRALQDILDLRMVDGASIQHNCCNQGRSGIVALKNKSEDLPTWVFSAMRCLAQWPSATSGLPKYPGFERDVFRTVRDYFLTLPQPLVPPYLTPLFLRILGGEPTTTPLGSLEDVMTSLLEHAPELPCYETTFTTAQPTTRLLFRSCSVGRSSDLKYVGPPMVGLRRRPAFNSADDLDNPEPSAHLSRRNFLRASLTASQRLARKVVRSTVGRTTTRVQTTSMRVNGVDLGVVDPGFHNPAFCSDHSPPRPPSQPQCFVNPASQRLWKLEALQLATLLLPPPRRRHLHLLLRMLSKMADNDRLEPLSDDGMPMEALLVQTFQQAILYTASVVERQMATRLVQLMMTECEEVFTPPLAALRSEVVEALPGGPGLLLTPDQENLPPPRCSTPKDGRCRSPVLLRKKSGGLTNLFSLRL